MKPVLALILSCVPLAVLTVWSFVELASGEARPPGPLISPSWEDESAAAAKARAQVQLDGLLLKGLAETDLFGADPISALQDVPSGGTLKPICDTWPQWLRVRQLVAQVVQSEPLAATTDVAQLQQAAGQIEEIKAKCQASPPLEGQQLLQWLDRRQAALKAQIAQRGRAAAAADVLAGARAAFQAEQYDRCVASCDQLLAKYADALESDALEKLRVLRGRAQFWSDVERLSQPSQSAQPPADRAALLRGFLDKYARREGRTDAEMRVLDRFGAELRNRQQQIATAESDRAAAALIEKLHEELPAAFVDRVARAAAIVDRYPTRSAKARLRDDARRWLGELLPEKQLKEPPTLQEAETTRGELVRGFFKEVQASDGTLSGYKCYPTYQQYVHPVAEVGTYRVEELPRRPGQSLPRQYVTRYQQARQKLLEHPERRDAWQELADLCRTLQAELTRYRAKPGGSSEELSFGREEAFARQMIDGPARNELARLFEP